MKPPGPRPLIECKECLELKPHAALGLCEACYQAQRRQSGAERFIDPHTAGISKYQKKLLRGFSETMSGIEKIGASREDTLKIRRLLAPYLQPDSSQRRNRPGPCGVRNLKTCQRVIKSYQQNLWKTLCKTMLPRLKSLATIAAIADCTRNDHSTNSSKYFAYSKFYDFF